MSKILACLFVLVCGSVCIPKCAEAHAYNASYFKARGANIVAHRKLPFGTRLRLTNLDNGRQYCCAIVHDRGPFVKGREWDVSEEIAQALGFFGQKGLADLHVDILGRY